MPHAPAKDGTGLYFEEAGSGNPICSMNTTAKSTNAPCCIKNETASSMLFTVLSASVLSIDA